MEWVANCAYCGVVVATASQMGDEEATSLNAHLQAAHPEEYVRSKDSAASEKLPFAEILRHFRMVRRS